MISPLSLRRYYILLSLVKPSLVKFIIIIIIIKTLNLDNSSKDHILKKLYLHTLCWTGFPVIPLTTLFDKDIDS